MTLRTFLLLAEDGGGAARDIRPYIMKLLRPWDNTVGVDIGCSQHKVCASAIGIDTRRGDHGQDGEPNSVTGGREAVNLVGDGLALPWFHDNTLDYVFSSHMLEHVPKDQALHALLRWHCVLKPGGRLILYLPDGRVREFPEYHQWHPVPEDFTEHLAVYAEHRVVTPRDDLPAADVVRSLAWSFLVIAEK